MTPRDEILTVLSCEIGKRPDGAPTGEQVFPLVTALERRPDALHLTFAPESGQAVADFVAAERLCCAGIGWELEHAPEPALRIIATTEQLDLFEQLIAAARSVSRTPRAPER